MKILILGSGVVGVCTAWFLSKEGHEVIVVDRQNGPALETSAGNAGQISPGYSQPWAAPGVPLKAVKWLFQKHAPLAIRPDFTSSQLRWMWEMLQNCNLEHYKTNKARMVRLAEYSRDVLQGLRRETGIEYEGRQGGLMQLFRTTQQFESAQRDIEVLKEAGVPYQLLESKQLSTAEPALEAVRYKLTGGLRLPNDETGDCQMFTRRLYELAVAAGVKFSFGVNIESLMIEGHKIVSVKHAHGHLTADAYVMACGSYSTGLLKSWFRLPVYPLKGYSLTIPLGSEEDAPASTVLDETYKVAITRFDSRIRVGGMAEIAGYKLNLNEQRKDTLQMVIRDLYPNCGPIEQATFWTGLRPMTPDGTPIIGKSPLRNLFLNTGHGTLGWTMSCGSGKLLSDIISGRNTDIQSNDLSYSRYVI